VRSDRNYRRQKKEEGGFINIKWGSKVVPQLEHPSIKRIEKNPDTKEQKCVTTLHT